MNLSTEAVLSRSKDSEQALPASRWASVLAGAWFLLAAVLLILLYARILHLSFDGDVHGWASSNVMTQARFFFESGPWRTHFVPVQNNLPLGKDPDVYLHWPPLVPLVTALAMRFLGDTEAAGRTVELLVSLCTAGLLFFLGRTLYSTRAGFLTGFFFLTAGATYNGGRLVVQPPMAVMFAVAAVVFYLLSFESKKRHLWAAAGVSCVVCMVLASWDAIFMPLGLLLVALYLRDRSRVKLAVIYLATAVLTFAVIQADYILSYPALFRDQVATIAYRMGLPFHLPAAVPLHSIVDKLTYQAQPSTASLLQNQLNNLVVLFPTIVLLAGCLFLTLWWRPVSRRDEKKLLIVGGLFFPWLFWSVVMHQYTSIHEFTLVLAAPYFAIASGVLLEELCTRLAVHREWRPTLMVVVVVLPALVIYPMAQATRHERDRFTKPVFGDFSALIQQDTPPNAIVLSPEQFSEPVYYSKRHIVRGIDSPALVEQAVTQAHAAFPASPLYLAVRTSNREGLADFLADKKPLATRGDSQLYALF